MIMKCANCYDSVATMLADKLKVIETMTDEIQTLRAKVASSEGWKPIETAPKDGTRLLLDIDHDDYGDRVWTGLWADGWMVSYGKAKKEPTHWMPLPAPTNTDVGE